MAKNDNPELRESVIVQAEDNDIRLDRWFKRNRPDIPHALLSRWARGGQITLEGAKTDPSDRVVEGQTISLPKAAAPAREPKVRVRKVLTPADVAMAQAMVIYRDEHALVINKPPGLATQGGTKTDEHVDGLLDALMYDSPRRPLLVHRLDKDTSGALLVARSSKGAAYFAKSFSSRTARKTYWALVVGVPDIHQGEIDLPIGKQPGSGGEKMHVDMKDGAAARTRYRVIERAGNRTAWVELMPYSGRTHQLRVHMAAIGHPIVGDGKYGGKDAFLTGTISRKMHLHARRLRIDHPTGGALDVTAELPPHFAESMDDIGFDMLLGDIGIEEEKGPPPPTVLKQQAKAHAKQIRKARRGERRSRVPEEGKASRTTRTAATKPGKAKPVTVKRKMLKGKRADAAAATGAKPAAPRSATAKPATAKSTAVAAKPVRRAPAAPKPGPKKAR